MIAMTMSTRWFAAFSFLLLAVHEAHELTHAIAGRLLCGEWPVRDFNSWHFTGACASWLPTAAGPAFSYALMLLGGLMILRAAGAPSRWAGVALILAANPFARLFTAVMGGGDEMVVAQRVAGLPTRTLPLRLAVIAVVGLLCVTAIATAWRGMAGVRRRDAPVEERAADFEAVRHRHFVHDRQLMVREPRHTVRVEHSVEERGRGAVLEVLLEESLALQLADVFPRGGREQRLLSGRRKP